MQPVRLLPPFWALLHWCGAAEPHVLAFSAFLCPQTRFIFLWAVATTDSTLQLATVQDCAVVRCLQRTILLLIATLPKGVRTKIRIVSPSQIQS